MAKVVSVKDIHVFDGPHASAISSSLSVRFGKMEKKHGIFLISTFDMKHFRFEVTLLPDYNIEEKQTMKIFIKIPPFEVPRQKHLNNTVLLHPYAIKNT